MGELEAGRLSALTAAAARFFADQLECGWASDYLAARGFGPQICREWGIGYAPATWTALTDHARDLGFTEPAIEAAGLAKRSARGTLIDVFRDRVMFPVRSLDGTVAGFIGRAPPGVGRTVPVYLNTATTSLYRKGSMLFGCYEGRPALAAGARPVIAEGPLDAIAITAAGHRNPAAPTAPAGHPRSVRHSGSATPGRYVGLAPCGTALTPAQVRLLHAAAGRHPAGVPNPASPAGWGLPGVIVAFDADTAGRRAAVRAYGLLRDITRDLLTVPFPAGADPAGYSREHGAAALAELLDSSPHPLADLVIDTRVAKFDRWLEFTDGKFSALHAAASLIAELPPHQVARQVARLADRLGLTYAEVTEAVLGALPDVISRSRTSPPARSRDS